MLLPLFKSLYLSHTQTHTSEMLQSLVQQSLSNPTTAGMRTRRLYQEDQVSGDTAAHNPAARESESTELRLLGLLLQCAEYVAADNIDGANYLLPEITQLSSPFGSSPERVASYFSHALQSRVINMCLFAFPTLPVNREQTKRICKAFQLYNSISPIVKFSNFTTNQAIREALDGEDRVHVIDLDIMHGLQWPGLFHILASTTRPGKIRTLRITGFGPSLELVEATGRRLADFAGKLGLPFEFIPVEGRVGEVADLGRVGIQPGEARVVHWMHHSLYDVTGDTTGAIRVLKLLKPKMMTMVEQDMSAEGDFLRRFVEALYYYSALFDAVGEGCGCESLDRHVVEQQLFGVEIKNIVGIGGGKGRWPEAFRRMGFRQVSLGGSAAVQGRLLLGMFPWKGYTLVEDNGFLKLGWKDLSLLKASAWQSMD